jgi:O-antigen/teichoic acid export membrane protein
MGAEAYGLVGFFSMLQAWFNLLDLGLSPTIARETARFQAGVLDRLTYARLLRTLQILFFTIAGLGGSVLFFASDYLSDVWLKLEHLSPAVVKTAIELMAGGVALRWMSGLYRGIISGSEKFVWLSSFNTAIATLRFIGVIPVLMLVGSSPVVFFIYQLGIASIEFVGLMLKAKFLAPVLTVSDQPLGSPRTLLAATAPVLQFALGSAFTTVVWVLVTQTDKLILSSLIPLSDYGFYTLAVLVAGGIPMMCMPITNSVQPRITKLDAEKDQLGEFALYRATTQLVMAIIVPITALMVTFPEVVLRIWTNDPAIAEHSAATLRLYALGNAILSVNALPLLLQFAQGNLRLHVLGNVIFAAIYLPLLIVLTRAFGTAGACWAWLGLNLFSFAVWVPYIHEKFFTRNHFLWLIKDVLPITLICVIPASAMGYFLRLTGNRLWDSAILAACGLFLTVCAISGSSLIREFIRTKVSARMSRESIIRL